MDDPKATKIKRRSSRVFSVVRRNLDQLEVEKIPALVTTCYLSYGFLWSDWLGRISMRSKDCAGFSSIKLQHGDVVQCSLTPIGCDDLDYGWKTSKIDKLDGVDAEKLGLLQSLENCMAKILHIRQGFGILHVKHLGDVFFSHNDYFEDLKGKNGSVPLMDYKHFQVIVAPTIYGHRARYRAVYVKPVSLMETNFGGKLALSSSSSTASAENKDFAIGGMLESYCTQRSNVSGSLKTGTSCSDLLLVEDDGLDFGIIHKLRDIFSQVGSPA